MHLIDASTAHKPAITSTWFIALLKFFFHKLTGGKLASSGSADHNVAPSGDDDTKQNGSADEPENDDTSSNAGSDAPGSGYSTPKNGDEARVKIAPTSKAGGMRRKNVKKRS